MCSIVGSFKKDKLIELCEINSYRGQHSHSISYFDIVTGEISVQKYEGKVDYNIIEQKPLVYMIVHMQAPTSEGDPKGTIHPAYFKGKFLWHNGILKQSYVQKLKESLHENVHEICNWDTFLMLKAISKDRKNINDLDGSFSCLMYDNEKLYVFRNEISPMFYDANLNISSTGFKGSRPTPPNQIHHMDFNFSSLFAVENFITRFNPYYIED